MGTPLKKLPLNRETIRELGGAEMAGVDGGWWTLTTTALLLLEGCSGGGGGGGNPQTAGFTNCVYCTNTPTSCGTATC
ncbi:MAG: hypothetical protein HYY17_12590 [Planctomycetes bacterium]|nr:hypothetical protein [Planctomycetota bacterium]